MLLIVLEGDDLAEVVNGRVWHHPLCCFVCQSTCMWAKGFVRVHVCGRKAFCRYAVAFMGRSLASCCSQATLSRSLLLLLLSASCLISLFPSLAVLYVALANARLVCCLLVSACGLRLLLLGNALVPESAFACMFFSRALADVLGTV